MSDKKFTDEEMQSLKELQEGYLRVQARFGQVSIAKLTLQQQSEELDDTEKNVMNEFSELQTKEKELVSQLTDKYGKGTLDPKSGVFTPDSSDENNK